MPRPRKPLEMLELTGHYRSDRHSQRRHAPKSDRPIGDPPACLAPDEAACWREFVGNAPAGVLTSGDRVALEVLARLLARWRRQGLTGGELAVLRGFLNELGERLPPAPARPWRALRAPGTALSTSSRPWARRHGVTEQKRTAGLSNQPRRLVTEEEERKHDRSTRPPYSPHSHI